MGLIDKCVSELAQYVSRFDQNRDFMYDLTQKISDIV